MQIVGQSRMLGLQTRVKKKKKPNTTIISCEPLTSVVPILEIIGIKSFFSFSFLGICGINKVKLSPTWKLGLLLK